MASSLASNDDDDEIAQSVETKFLTLLPGAKASAGGSSCLVRTAGVSAVNGGSGVLKKVLVSRKGCFQQTAPRVATKKGHLWLL